MEKSLKDISKIELKENKNAKFLGKGSIGYVYKYLCEN